MLALEDMKDSNEQDVKNHLADEYGNASGTNGNVTNADRLAALEMLKRFDVLIAYESVGSWGCDSSSFYLLREHDTGNLFEINGSHCSCYGFEGQLDLEPTTKEALLMRDRVFYCGGYDENSESNSEQVRKYIESL